MNSIFELFSIGIGPSSSHTVGPMKAANRFCFELEKRGMTKQVERLNVDLFGSLASTGEGHGTDQAVVFGLMGFKPDTINVEKARLFLEQVRHNGELCLNGTKNIRFSPKYSIAFNGSKPLPLHPNGMIFKAFAIDGSELLSETYYSTGGGFICKEDEFGLEKLRQVAVKYPFQSFAELRQLCEKHDLSIANISLANEESFTTKDTIKEKCLQLWFVMEECVEGGLLSAEKVLPGGLSLKRRAPKFYKSQRKAEGLRKLDTLSEIDWLNVCAMAVSEENASGNRVVTAPTNGAAGIIPAVLSYINVYKLTITKNVASEFFAVASAIGNLYKMNASISGAEVGCQGEVGVACSMAAGALAHILGGDIDAVENAAEIAMEHHLGLTCDPVGGLVQVPCIERNAIAAVKALNAARMAVYYPNETKVSLDKVIKTMYQTGKDMGSKYKETSEAGLAINVSVIKC